MNNELRDKIADKIEYENCCYVCRDGALMAAQAIIDDLGLHVIETTGGVIGKLERT